MQTLKSTIITLFFVLLSHALLAEGRSEGMATAEAALPVKTAQASEIRQLAHTLDMRHVSNSSYHLDDPASYYHSKQKRLIRALKPGVK